MTDRAELAKRPQHWAVSVDADGEQIVCIESNCLSGREISEQDEETIRNAAHHLLSFIGDGHQAAALSAGEGGAVVRCSICNGAGKIWNNASPEERGHIATCPKCSGTGEQPNSQPRKDGEANPEHEPVSGKHNSPPLADAEAAGAELARDRWPDLTVVEVESMRRDANEGEHRYWAAIQSFAHRTGCLAGGDVLKWLAEYPHSQTADVPAGASEDGLRELIEICNAETAVLHEHTKEANIVRDKFYRAARKHIPELVAALRRLSPSADLLKAAKAKAEEFRVALEKIAKSRQLGRLMFVEPIDEYIVRIKKIASAAIRSAEGDEG